MEWQATKTIKNSMFEHAVRNCDEIMEQRENSNRVDSCSHNEESIVTSRFVQSKLERRRRDIDSLAMPGCDVALPNSGDMKLRVEGGGVAKMIQKFKFKKNRGNDVKMTSRKNIEETRTSWKESALAAVDNLRGKLALFRRTRSLDSPQEEESFPDQTARGLAVERTRSAPDKRSNYESTQKEKSPISLPAVQSPDSNETNGIPFTNSDLSDIQSCSSFHCLPSTSAFCVSGTKNENVGTIRSTESKTVCGRDDRVVYQQPNTGAVGILNNCGNSSYSHEENEETWKEDCELGATADPVRGTVQHTNTPVRSQDDEVDVFDGKSEMLWNLRQALEGEVKTHLERQRYLSTTDDGPDVSPRSTASGGTFFLRQKSIGFSEDESAGSSDVILERSCHYTNNEVATGCHSKLGRSRADFLNAYEVKEIENTQKQEEDKTTTVDSTTQLQFHKLDISSKCRQGWCPDNDDVINRDVDNDDVTDTRLLQQTELTEEVLSRNLSLPLMQHFPAGNDVTDGDSPVTHHWSRHSSAESPGRHQIVRFFAEDDDCNSAENNDVKPVTSSSGTNLRSTLSTSSDDILMSEDTSASTSSSARNESETSEKKVQPKAISPTTQYQKAQSPLSLGVAPTHHYKRRQRPQITRPKSTASSGTPSPSSPTVGFAARRLPHAGCSTDSNDSLDSQSSGARQYSGRKSLSRIFRRSSSQRSECPPTFCGYTMGRDRCVDETTDRIFKEFLFQDKPGPPTGPLAPNELLPPPSHMLPPRPIARDAVTQLRRQVMRKQYSDSIAMFYGQRMRRMKVSKQQTSGSLDCTDNRGILRRQDKVEEEFDPEEISEQMVGSSSGRRDSDKPEYIPPTIHELKEWRRSSKDRKPVLRHTNSLPSDTSSPDVKNNDLRTPTRRVSFVHE
ncbi:uncharacterized protein LOC108950277 isoform X1 [Ciona intestinalis]